MLIIIVIVVLILVIMIVAGILILMIIIIEGGFLCFWNGVATVRVVAVDCVTAACVWHVSTVCWGGGE